MSFTASLAKDKALKSNSLTRASPNLKLPQASSTRNANSLKQRNLSQPFAQTSRGFNKIMLVDQTQILNNIKRYNYERDFQEHFKELSLETDPTDPNQRTILSLFESKKHKGDRLNQTICVPQSHNQNKISNQDQILLPPLKSIYQEEKTGYQDFFSQFFKETKHRLVDEAEEVSMKEMAKHRAISKKQNVELYKQIDSKKDTEVTIRDVADSDRDSVQDEDEDGFLSNEFWEEIGWHSDAQEKAIQLEVGNKLEAFLLQNSSHLSAQVQDYLNKGEGLSARDMISSLGMLTFERKRFIQTLAKLRRAFRVELRTVKQSAKSKCDAFLFKMFTQVQVLFKQEMSTIVGQYHQMRKLLAKTEWENERLTKMNTQLEEQLAFRDRHFDHIPIKFIDLIEDGTVLEQGELNANLVEEANSILREPFSFYSGYVQISMNTKDEILESEAFKRFLCQKRQMEHQLEMKEHEIDTHQALIDKYIRDEGKLAERINILEQEMLKKIKEAEDENRRFEFKYRTLYDEFVRTVEMIQSEYRGFKKLAEEEFKVKDQLIETLLYAKTKMTEELKDLKTVLTVPRLRNQLKDLDMKNTDFVSFLTQMDSLTQSIKKQLRHDHVIIEVEEEGQGSVEQLKRPVHSPIKSKAQSKLDTVHSPKIIVEKATVQGWESNRKIKAEDSQMSLTHHQAFSKRSPSTHHVSNNAFNREKKSIQMRATSTLLLLPQTDHPTIDNSNTKKLLHNISKSPPSTNMGSSIRNSEQLKFGVFPSSVKPESVIESGGRTVAAAAKFRTTTKAHKHPLDESFRISSLAERRDRFEGSLNIESNASITIHVSKPDN